MDEVNPGAARSPSNRPHHIEIVIGAKGCLPHRPKLGRLRIYIIEMRELRRIFELPK